MHSGYGVWCDEMGQVKDLWVRQYKTYSVVFYRVADTQPILQNQTTRARQSWN
jgi:hypothetical protein